jgi:hypothetical protein
MGWPGCNSYDAAASAVKRRNHLIFEAEGAGALIFLKPLRRRKSRAPANDPTLIEQVAA